MVVKKKTVRKETAIAEPIEHEEERRPPVTQVVEVLEDQDDESTHTAVAAPTGSMESLEDAPMEEVNEGVDRLPPMDERISPPSTEEDQKRRVLVDELFQKKSENTMPPVAVTPEISMHKKPRTAPVIMWAIVLIVSAMVAGGIILAVSGQGVSLPSIMATPTPTPTTTPSPTPTPDVSKLDRSALSIQVLNGSGTPGLAGKVKALLEEKGYTVDNTGNADNYDYTSTQILVKAEHEAYIPLLEEDLKEDYSLGTSEATLDEDVTYDVRIIVGKE
jgi:hypothetical protein